MKFSPLSSVLLASVAFVLLASTSLATLVERPLSATPLAETLSDAHTVAAQHSDMQVLRIAGTSMLPFFGDGSVVIVKKISADALRAGMVVVYQNRFGETVAHRLVAPTAKGWTAQGYNNASADTTVVTDANLMGVVYATFHSNGQTDRLPGLAALMGKTQVALAAPAK